MAAAPDCDSIHGRASAVLSSLLHTLRARAPFICSCLTQDLIFLALELSGVLYSHIATLTGIEHGVGMDAPSRWPKTLECFTVSAGSASYLTPAPLILSSPAALESLTATTISVLTGVLRGVVSPHDLSTAWEAACSFLANGNARLRRLSMAMLRQLVELRGFPERQGHEFFSAFLHLLQTQPQTHVPNAKPDDVADPYKGELLLLTRSVFRSPAASHSHFEQIFLLQMFEGVCTLGAAGVELGPEVTESLCLLFDFLLSDSMVYESAPFLRRERVTDVCRTLAQTIGTENQAEVRRSSQFWIYRDLF